MSFQIEALPAAPFAGLFALDAAALRARGARRMVVETSPGTPCLVSLADARVGETVVLVNHEHQPGDSPYRSRHAIFVREGAAQAHPTPGTVPDVLRRRLISLRCFDEDHMMVDADVVDGTVLAERLEACFSDGKVAYVHLHYAKPGCFAASVIRADASGVALR